MDAQIIVAIVGALLLAAILVALAFLRRDPGRYTYDTHGGTRPRASQGEGNTEAVSAKRRFQGLTFAVTAVFGALIAKLWSMQMVSSDHYEKLADQNLTRTVTTPAPRGRILDRNGEPLVTNRASLTVAAYRDLADDAVTVRHLANVLGMPYMAVRRNIQDYSQSAQSLHTIASDVPRSTIAYIQEHIDQFPGVEVVERTERVYPHGSLACHVLGYTGTITQEQLDAQQKNAGQAGSISYQSGDIVGQSGVESRYESLLQGIRGEQTVQVDASGNVTGQTADVPAKPGSDVKLTLDLTIQQACEDGLKLSLETGQTLGYTADAGAIVCMDVTNGEVLGLASAPSFDPSVFIGGVSSDVWAQLNSEDGGTPMLNRATAGQYMSASTIKPLCALAGLEYGTYTASQTTVCTGFWTGFGKTYGKWCWLHSGHGTMNLQNGITHSCDPVFYDLGKAFYDDEEHREGLQEVFRRWGLGSTCGIDLPSESAGRVPDAAWKQAYFKSYSDADRQWLPGDTTNIAIGQGDILVTPLQMACAYMGLANGGKEYTPHVFLSAVARDGDGDAATYGSRERLTAKVNASSDLELVRAGMKGVIYNESATLAKHFNNLSKTVYGKSGTGEKKSGSKSEDPYAWFCAYAPAEDPKYVISVVVEHGGYGGTTAMPALRHVLGVIYNEPDDVSYTSGGGDSSR